MPGRADEFDLDGLAFWAGAAMLAYIFVNFIRQQAATDAGGPVFSPTGPNFPQLNEGIDLLVPMSISAAGAAFIRQAEGLTLTRKQDGAKQVIGYGHDIQPGENIPQRITMAQAEALLQSDLIKIAGTLNRLLTVPVTQNQFDALGSLDYNIGDAAFQNSTLLRLLNQGDYSGAAAQFTRWDLAGGEYNAGLYNRRTQEQGTFNGQAAS